MLKMREGNGLVEEVWKEIEEAPNCFVSNLGRVKVGERTITDVKGITRIYKEKMVAQNKKKTGYMEVGLPVDVNKRIYRLVHRLVLMAFDPRDNQEDLEVNHKDEDKTNNILSNLEWMTSKENCNYGTRNERCSKAREKKVKCITTNIIYNSLTEAAKATGCNKPSIFKCCRGIYSQTHGLQWEYYND